MPPISRAEAITSHDGTRSTRPESCPAAAAPNESARKTTPAMIGERSRTCWR